MWIVEEIVDGWGDGWAGKAVVSVVGALILCIVALVVLLAFTIYRDVDSWHLHEGVIIEKQYQPMWVQQNCHTVGKTVTCTPIIHPESWSVIIEGVDDRGQQNRRQVQVSESRWNELEEGEHLKID